ncbi:cellulose binding domain-containing protein [Streptosporangium lutulentum]
MVVKNAGTVPITGWATSWTFPGGQISQAWNATLTQSGSAVTARNAAWNGSLAPGATATFGFISSGTGSPHRRCPARPARDPRIRSARRAPRPEGLFERRAGLTKIADIHTLY